jgi:hypothetical protein
VHPFRLARDVRTSFTVDGRTEIEVAPAPTELTPRAIQTPRAAGAAGVVFAVLFGLIVVLIHRVVPANPHDAGTWLTRSSNRHEVQLALALVPFCGIFFLWFMGAVRSRVGAAEDRFFATVFLGSGLLFVAMLFVLAAVFGALVSLAGAYGGTPPLDIWRLGRVTTFNLTTVFAMRMAAVFTIASSTIALRVGAHSRVVAYLGYVVAVALLFAGPKVPWVLLAFPAWVFIVSVNLLIVSFRRSG